MKRRVVVTGMGVVTSLGQQLDTFWDNLTAGRSGISLIEPFGVKDLGVRIAGQVKDFTPDGFIERKDSRLMERFTHFALVASLRALADAKLEVARDADPERVGVVIGSGTGGQVMVEQQTLALHRGGAREVHPYYVPMMLINIAPAHVAMRTGARGPTTAFATACSAGAHSIGEAFRSIQRDETDVMICGGTETPLTPLALAGFSVMRALSTRNEEPERASRPFDRDRNGFVIAEGAGVMILESLEHALARKARIYAELIGYGLNTDGFHMTMPSPQGSGAARCMQRAMANAGIRPEEMDYINTHGTATKLGDVSETKGIKAAFGEHARQLVCSSTKSMTGHMLGAAGAVESIITVLSVVHDKVPPTINLESLDPECDLDYAPGKARERRVRTAMSNSFAFGGHNASLIFRKYEAQPQS
jgi:3-oxoacyl-[acyl-carrier-protein] synthase II